MFVTMTRTMCRVNIIVAIDYTAFKNPSIIAPRQSKQIDPAEQQGRFAVLYPVSACVARMLNSLLFARPTFCHAGASTLRKC